MEPYSESTENHASSATVDAEDALPPGSMSLEQPAVAEPPVRRRIVSAPQRKVTPIALILRERGSLPALEGKLQAARPVVVFPSLSHFCTESHRSEPWAGVVVARACAWDARLDDYVSDRACIALYEDAEGYGWPDAVHRLGNANLEGIDTWLQELDTPRLPVARPRKKRPSEGSSTPRTKRSKVVFSLWAPNGTTTTTTNGVSTSSHGASTPNGSAASVVTRTAAPSQPKVTTRVEQTVTTSAAQAKQLGYEKAKAARAKKVVPVQQTLPFAEAREEKKRARQALRDELIGELSRPRAKARGAEKRAATRRGEFSRAEELVARMGAEIGLPRAAELLHELRRRAKALGVR